MPGALASQDAIFTEQDTLGRSYPITELDVDAGTFGIDGDHASDFILLDNFLVIGSTSNDREYVVRDVSYDEGSDTTTVTVDQGVINSLPADGAIYPSAYRAAFDIPAGSIVHRVMVYCLAPWAASPLYMNVIDGVGWYIQAAGIDQFSAPYDPLDPVAGPLGNWLSGDRDNDGIPSNLPDQPSYAPAVTEFYRSSAFANSQTWMRPGVPYDTDTTVYATVAVGAADGSPTGVLRAKIEYFAPVTAIDATFA